MSNPLYNQPDTEVFTYRRQRCLSLGISPRNANKIAETGVSCDLVEKTLEMCKAKCEDYRTAEDWMLYLLDITELRPIQG